MSNPLNAGTQRQSQTQMSNFEQLYQRFAPNWKQYLAGLNLPQDIQTPEQAVRFLAQNGQIPPLIQKQVYSMLNRRY